MTDRRAPKKSETIEIRLAHDAKAAFMRRCREDEVSASEAIRTMIDARLSPRPESHSRPGRWRMVAAVAAGMALGAGAAAPALAHAGLTTRAAFDRLDRNHDGVLSYDEFRAR